MGYFFNVLVQLIIKFKDLQLFEAMQFLFISKYRLNALVKCKKIETIVVNIWISWILTVLDYVLQSNI